MLVLYLKNLCTYSILYVCYTKMSNNVCMKMREQQAMNIYEASTFPFNFQLFPYKYITKKK